MTPQRAPLLVIERPKCLQRRCICEVRPKHLEVFDRNARLELVKKLEMMEFIARSALGTDRA